MNLAQTELKSFQYSQHLGQVLWRSPPNERWSVRTHSPDALGWSFHSVIDFEQTCWSYPLLVLVGKFKPVGGKYWPEKLGRPMYAYGYLSGLCFDYFEARTQIAEGTRVVDRFGNQYQAREMAVPKCPPVLALLPENWPRQLTKVIYDRCGFIRVNLKD